MKKYKCSISGDLLRKFDDYCVVNEYRESEAIRECIKFYLSSTKEDNLMWFYLIKHDVDNMKFRRRLQTVLWGSVLDEFSFITSQYHIKPPDLIREAIRIKVTHGKRNNP